MGDITPPGTRKLFAALVTVLILLQAITIGGALPAAGPGDAVDTGQSAEISDEARQADATLSGPARQTETGETGSNSTNETAETTNETTETTTNETAETTNETTETTNETTETTTNETAETTTNETTETTNETTETTNETTETTTNETTETTNETTETTTNETAETTTNETTEPTRTESTSAPGAAGAARDGSTDVGPAPPSPVAPASDNTSFTPEYKAFMYAVQEIAFFSYDDSTQIAGPDGQLTLDEGETSVTGGLSRGTYEAAGNKRFSMLAGDPDSSSVIGYYGVDQNGFGVSEEIRTWVPPRSFSSDAKFIIFGYENGSDVRVTDTESGETIWSGTLNASEHKELTGSAANSFVRVTGSEPVSALTYYDQGYYAPATNGQFTGKKFYTYAAQLGGWTNNLIVTAYSSGTEITIRDTETGEEISTATLEAGEQHVEAVNDGRYFTVDSSAPVSVAVQPHRESWSGSYHQNHYTPSRSGSFIGREFVEDTIDGDYMYAFAYENDTEVNLFDADGNLERSVTLDRGEDVEFSPGAGTWRVVGNKSISMVAGYGRASASFAPLEFGRAESGTIEGRVQNTGEEPISDATVRLYDARYFPLAWSFSNVSAAVVSENVTVEDGRYQFQDVEPGEYVVAARNDSQITISSLLYVSKGNTLNVSLTIADRSNSLGRVTEEFNELGNAYRSVHDENTRTAAEVLVRGYDVLPSNLIDSVSIDDNDAMAFGSAFLGAGNALDEVDYEEWRDIRASGGSPRRYAARLIAEEVGEELLWTLVGKATNGYAQYGGATLAEPAIDRPRLRENAQEVADAEWMRDGDIMNSASQVRSQGYEESDIYTETVSGIDETESDHEEYGRQLSDSEIPDEFDRGEVAAVLNRQERWVEGNGPVDGIIITPNGKLYRIKQTRSYATLFRSSDRRQDQAEAAADVSAFVAFAADVGTAVGAISGPQTAAAAQGIAWTATASELAFNALQQSILAKMTGEWVGTQVYWANDADNINQAYADTDDWVRSEVEDPRVHEVDGEITEADIQGVDSKEVIVSRDGWNVDIDPQDTTLLIANRPRPDGDELVVTQFMAASETDIEYKNTGSLDDQKMRVFVTNQEVGEPIVGQPTVKETRELDPDEEASTSVPFTTQYSPAGEVFSNNRQTVFLWSEGKIVDVETRTYHVVPDAQYPVAERAVLDVVHELNQQYQRGEEAFQDGREWVTTNARDGTQWIGDRTVQVWDTGTSAVGDGVDTGVDIGQSAYDGTTDCASDVGDCAEDIGSVATDTTSDVADGATDCASDAQDCAGDLIDKANPFSAPALSGNNTTAPSMTGDTVTNESRMDQYLNNATTVVDRDMTPENATASATVRTTNSTAHLRFIAITEPGAEVNIEAVGPDGRRVGYDTETGREVVGIPNASYSGRQTNPQQIQINNTQTGNYTVRAEAVSFDSTNPQSVEVIAIRVPERPAIMAAAPGRIDVPVTTGESTNRTVMLSEVGKQEAIETVQFRRTTFRNDNGTALPDAAEADISAQNFDVAAGNNATAQFQLNLTNATVETSETRYNGHLVVKTENAGTLSLNVSTLVLDTALSDVTLATADQTVTGAHVSAANPTAIDADRLPTSASPERAYETQFRGNGSVTLDFDVSDAANRTAYVETNGTWLPAIQTARNGTLQATMPASTERVAITQATPHVAVAIKPAPNASADPTLQAVNGGHESTVAVRQLNPYVPVENVTVGVGDRQRPASSTAYGDWLLNRTFEPTYNETAGRYETRTVTVNASGTQANSTRSMAVRVLKPGDANGDGSASLRDAVALGTNWNESLVTGSPTTDLNNDGHIDEADAAMLREHFTPSMAVNETEAES